MNSVEALKNVGLTDKEARVYVALLQLGRASSYAVSVKSGLKKPTTYVILDELVEKGFAHQIPRAKKKMYVPVSPDEVFGIAEEKLEVARQALPELKSLTKETDKVNTLYFEGLKGLREAMWYRMEEQKDKTMVGFYAANLDTPPEGYALIDEWQAALRKRNITLQGITPKHESLRQYFEGDWGRTKLIDFKFLPYEEYSSKISMEAVLDMVRILDFNEESMQAVIVENKHVADMVRQVFNIAWNNVDAPNIEEWIGRKN